MTAAPPARKVPQEGTAKIQIAGQTRPAVLFWLRGSAAAYYGGAPSY